jgi:hypothetical protein
MCSTIPAPGIATVPYQMPQYRPQGCQLRRCYSLSAQIATNEFRVPFRLWFEGANPQLKGYAATMFT